MKNPLRNLLFFSPQAQRGLLLLCLAIVAFACLVPVYERRAQRAAQPAAVPGEAYQDFRATLQQEATAGQPDADLHANSLPGVPLPEPVLRPFPFDPNRADSATLRRLGLPERTTQHIVRYRDKGGRFRQAEDFRQIYGLTDEQYAALRPFLRLTPADTLHPRVQPLWADNPGDNMPGPGKYPAGTVVDLNRADTSELKRIPGIGSAIARRIAICASEDVGNADPQALVVAMAAVQAVQFVGMPEARIPLAQAVTYVASAPKSNASYLAIDKALADVRAKDCGPVPVHLRDCHYKGAAKLGHGVNYKYAHDYPYHIVKQDYLPAKMKGTKYYTPTTNGYEKNISQYLQFCAQLKK